MCAVIIEGVQGVGGLDQGEAAFVKALPDLCKKYDALLILDEIQSGFGRTGVFSVFSIMVSSRILLVWPKEWGMDSLLEEF